MMTGNIQATTATAGNFRSSAMLERGTRMGSFGFQPLLVLFGFLLFVLFIFITVRLIQLARRSEGNYGSGYQRQLHESCECKNKPEQKAKSPWLQERPDAALEILRKRFAAGEIKKEEFEEKEQILKG